MSLLKKLWKTKKPNNQSKQDEVEDDAPPERYGLFLYEDYSAATKALDIIAVHGLGGHWCDTWTAENGKNCIRDSIPSKLKAAGINSRVFSYGYNSSTAFSRAVTDITDEAAMLLDQIKGERKPEAERSRPIMFIAHSLGGILVKKAMIIAHERSSEYGEVLSSVKSIMFLGTPHRGSDAAYWATYAAMVLKVVQLGRGTNPAFVSALQKNSNEFANISQQWIERAARLRIRTFHETERLYGELVVDKDSARLGLVNEIAVGVAAADHRSICKYKDFNSQRYRPIWNATEELAQYAIGGSRNMEVKLTDDEARCLQALYTSNYEAHRQRNINREAGTCEWIFAQSQYQEWISKSESSLLWISADPGCGKSVLASFLVEHFEAPSLDSPRIICHFFFKDDTETQRGAETAICAILHQLFTVEPRLVRYATTEYLRKGKQMTTELNGLWEIFLRALADDSCATVILTLDGLDECEEKSRKQILRLLTDFYKKRSQPGCLMTIVASRPHHSIRMSFGDAPTIRLKTENHLDAIDADVRRVVQARLARFATRMNLVADPKLAQLENSMLRKADRTFLWVSLILDMIDGNSCRTFEELCQIVDQPNPSLDSLYERILSGSNHPEMARKMLNIIIAALEPLTMEQLDIACAMNFGDKTTEDFEPQRFLSIEYGIRDTCGLFLRIIEGKVFLVHQTAREFLLATENGHHINKTERKLSGAPTIEQECSMKISRHATSVGHQISWKHSFDPVASNQLMAELCIFYLLLDYFRTDYIQAETQCHPKRHTYQFRVELDKLAIRYPLLQHACSYWTTYYASAQERTDRAIDDFALVLLSDLRRLPIWSFLSRNTVLSREKALRKEFDFELPDTPLGKAAYFGLHSMVHRILESGADVNERDYSGYTPLFYATVRGAETVLSVLLEHEADVNISGDRASPLAASVWRGDLRITKLLLDHGADVNGRYLNGRTPLFLASEQEVISLLLDHGANVRLQDRNNQTAIEFTVDSGSLTLVETLLEGGFNINTFTGPDSSMLLQAVATGKEDLASLLLLYGADAQFTTTTGWTLLHEAAQKGHDKVAKVLLQNGAPTNSTELNQQTPLHVAAVEAFGWMVELLLTHGAEADPRDAWHRTPLGSLSDHQIPESKAADAVRVIELLIDAGADPNSRDADGYTPFLRAMERSNHMLVIEYLLIRGADLHLRTNYGEDFIDLLIKSMPDWRVPGFHAFIDNGLELLLEHGFKLESRNAHSLTPLMRSVLGGTIWLTKAFLDAGADPFKRDRRGMNAYDMAKERGYSDSAEVIIILRVAQDFARENKARLKGEVPEPSPPHIVISGSPDPNCDIKHPSPHTMPRSDNNVSKLLGNPRRFAVQDLSSYGDSGLDVIRGHDQIDRAQTASPLPR